MTFPSIARQNVFAVTCLAAVATTDCSGASTPAAPIPIPTSTPVPTPKPSSTLVTTLTVSPSSIRFTNTPFPSQIVTVSKASPLGLLQFSISNPAVAGMSDPVINGNTATFTVYGVSSGSTTITVSDGYATGGLSVTDPTCTSPDDLNPSPVHLGLLLGPLYFGVYTVSATPPETRLHLIETSSYAPTQTADLGPLAPIALPSGVPTAPPPPPGRTLTYMTIAAPGGGFDVFYTYEAQLYDMACEPPEDAGVIYP